MICKGIFKQITQIFNQFIIQVPNTSPTAASSGSDINGAAVLDACNKINRRLQPYKNKMPDAKLVFIGKILRNNLK